MQEFAGTMSSETAQLLHNNKLLIFPPQGQIIICTDLHGNIGDFHTIREKFYQSLVKEQETYLLFIGDLIHGPAIHPNVWPDHLGDYYYDHSDKLIAEFVNLQQEHPGKVFSLLGNHEHSHIGGPHTCKFHRDETLHFENIVGPRRAKKYQKIFRSFPLIALGQKGLVFTHGSPRCSLRSLAQLDRISYEGYEHLGLRNVIYAPVVGELLWSRMATKEEARRFLKITSINEEPNKVSICGHDVVREGYDKVGREQIVVSTSFALKNENKFYLHLSLEETYTSVQAFREGVELLKLYED